MVDAVDLFDEPPTLSWTERFLATDGHHLVFAFDGDTAVGFVSAIEMVHPDKGGELFVYELGTAESHRRRGIGRALIEEAVELARETRCYGLWVATEPDNEPALATYRAAGFELAEPSVVLAKQVGEA